VYVNADNPVKELSLEQLEKIFTGKIKNWQEVGGPNAPIVV
jgi:phosphate transport system substrate-binding protein